MNTSAFLDALYITQKLSKRYGDVAFSEVHLFGYLGCLLALYDGQGANFWDYIFVTGNSRAPYARELEDAMESLMLNGLVSVTEAESEQFVKLTEAGAEELEMLGTFGSYADRMKYLKSSCETILLVNLPDIRAAIRKEPSVAYSHKWNRNEALVSEGSNALNVLYDQFDSLKTALQDKYTDMLIPAVTWIKFLEENRG